MSRHFRPSPYENAVKNDISVPQILPCDLRTINTDSVWRMSTAIHYVKLISYQKAASGNLHLSFTLCLLTIIYNLYYFS